MRKNPFAAATAASMMAILTWSAIAAPAAHAASAPETPSGAPVWPDFSGSAQHTGYFAGVGPTSATLEWRYRVTNGTVPAYGVAIGGDGTVFVTGDTSVDALTPSGALKWSDTYPASVEGPSIAANGTVYITSDDSIVALNPSNGSQEWSYTTGGNVIFDPTVGSNGTIYEGSWDGYLYALNPNGTLKWRFKSQQAGGVFSYPVSVSANGQTVYVGGGDAHAGPDPHFYVLDAATGALEASYDTGNTRVGTPVVSSGGTVYVPAQPQLIAFSSTGSLEWKLPAANGGGSSCSPPPAPCSASGNGPSSSSTSPSYQSGIIPPALGSDGTLYNGTDTGTVFALNSATRTVEWSYQTGPNPTDSSLYGNASFPLVDSEGTVYIGSDDYRMYAISKTGKVLWSYKTGGTITEASPAFGSNGTLYFTSSDGYLYAVGPGVPA